MLFTLIEIYGCGSRIVNVLSGSLVFNGTSCLVQETSPNGASPYHAVVHLLLRSNIIQAVLHVALVVMRDLLVVQGF